MIQSKFSYFFLFFNIILTLACQPGTGVLFKDKNSGEEICLLPKMNITASQTTILSHIDEIKSYESANPDLYVIPARSDGAMTLSGWLWTNPDDHETNETIVQLISSNGESIAALTRKDDVFVLNVQAENSANISPKDYINTANRWVKFSIAWVQVVISLKLNEIVVSNHKLSLNDTYLLISIGGGMQGTFTGKIRGLVISPNITMLQYGIDEVIHHNLFLTKPEEDQSQPYVFRNQESLAVGPFNNFSLISIHLRIGLLNQSLNILWEDCGLMSLLTSKDTEAATLTISHKFFETGSFDLHIGNNSAKNRFAVPNFQNIELFIFNNSETKEFIIYNQAHERAFVKNKYDKISLKFGAFSKLKSCHFFVYDFMIIKGGISTHPQARDPCFSRDLFGLCISCSVGYSMKLPERRCKLSCPASCIACYSPNICLDNIYPAKAAVPFCSNTSIMACKECENGYQLHKDHSCRHLCPKGEYAYLNILEERFQCQKCRIPHCEDCIAAFPAVATECDKCTKGYLRYKGNA